MSDSIETDNAELLTPRELRREFAVKMDDLMSGRVEKLVLMQRSQMAAVVIPLERYVQLLKAEEGTG
jgi:hypothetical protein